MTWMARVSLVVGVLAPVILIGGGAFSASADNLRKIVMFVDGTSLDVQQTVVALSGSSVLHTLSLINALAIQLPALTADQALAFLESKVTGLCNPLLDPLCVVAGVYDDAVGMVDGGTWPVCIAPASPPAPQSYPWGQQQIQVPAVHPQWQGTGVTVAIVDTGIASHPELNPGITGGYNALGGDRTPTTTAMGPTWRGLWRRS